jgi:uncharacterized membrane protein HdeD (DUF308 family)
MKSYSEYWTATLVRGVIAIIAGTGVMFFPEMASTMLLRPFGVVVTILCLAAYGVLDSALVLAISFMIKPHMPGRLALRLQGLVGVTISILLFALVYDRVNLMWFVYLAAMHAAAAAVVEFIVAKGTARCHGENWCYVSGAIALLSAIALLLGRNGSPREVTWLLFAYLGVFGFNLFALSARMLFAEHELLHAKDCEPVSDAPAS